jgi:endo-1,4-beta-xylanase
MNKFRTGGICFLLICAGFFMMGCNKEPEGDPPERNPPDGNTGVKVTTWEGLTAPPATYATQYGTYQGKTNVLHLSPSGPAFDWAVLTYSLNDYAGKEIIITLSMDVWLETSSRIAWQANLGSSYPLIAGSTTTTQAAVRWISITGGNTITVPAGGGTLYLSNDATYGLNNARVYIANFVMTIEEVSPLQEGEILLTIGDKKDLAAMLTNSDMNGKDLAWTTNNAGVASVTANGIVSAVNFTSGGTSTASSVARGTATITAKTVENITKTFTIITTMESQINMMDLTPLKDQFAGNFLIGNITTPGDYNYGASGTVTNTRLTRHYNVLTAENDMKPSYYGGSRSGTVVSGLTFNQSDNFVNAATASGFKIHAHVLLWHSQNSAWITSVGDEANKTTAIEAMKSYITQVVTHYKGKIYSWDVLNEVFPDTPAENANWKTAMRSNNPWFKAIGSDFVYEGYKAARLADPNAILYYNDYNLDNANKAGATHRMVRDVNEEWKKDPQYDGRLLIEGIGMQSHHNTGISADAVKATLDLFKLLGVKISISEIDVLSQSWNEYSNSTPPTNDKKLQAANLYGEYFKLFIQYRDIIERVTFWGVYDEQSWRARGLPLIFEGSTTSKAKPAYYKVVGVLE